MHKDIQRTKQISLTALKLKSRVNSGMLEFYSKYNNARRSKCIFLISTFHVQSTSVVPVHILKNKQYFTSQCSTTKRQNYRSLSHLLWTCTTVQCRTQICTKIWVISLLFDSRCFRNRVPCRPTFTPNRSAASSITKCKVLNSLDAFTVLLLIGPFSVEVCQWHTRNHFPKIKAIKTVKQIIFCPKQEEANMGG